MSGHLLGVLEPSVVFQVNRDPSCSPGVTSNRGKKTRRLGSLPVNPEIICESGRVAEN